MTWVHCELTQGVKRPKRIENIKHNVVILLGMKRRLYMCLFLIEKFFNSPRVLNPTKT